MREEEEGMELIIGGKEEDGRGWKGINGSRQNCLAHTQHAAKQAAKFSKVFSHSEWSLKIMARRLSSE